MSIDLRIRRLDMEKRIYVLVLTVLAVLLNACAGSPQMSQTEARQKQEQMDAELNQEILDLTPTARHKDKRVIESKERRK
jgi:starvation-inducible outer membrane lipoprotein